ncbi:MAG: DUF2062 domain-containing protein [Prosthecobacter sp.]|jgi:uncharacterized protein (DUF2062 family)|uniref:DUF2062 domain-containing protein n=1 Tax=Prosthecobacter sp. TaxID=1965333 RepID=UPI0019FDB373|nr:DUF2062 domain-containing protein [Prosthecobacter sp.]MBE2287702.1 DUF2062 domain-containing protein [Prosthecobacter sp.]
MLTLARGWFRRTVFKTIRFLKHPRKLRDRPTMRWFARHFLDKRVWKPTQHTLSGGMAVGMFITLQLLPIQMPTATILAAIFRVNIPIAIAMCWLSNPFTIPFIAWLEYAIGKWFLALYTTVPTTPFPNHLPESMVDAWLVLKEHAPVMLVGGIILGAVCSLVSYVGTWGFWEVGTRMEAAKKLRTARPA